jgi:hypothetical protein
MIIFTLKINSFTTISRTLERKKCGIKTTKTYFHGTYFILTHRVQFVDLNCNVNSFLSFETTRVIKWLCNFVYKTALQNKNDNFE